jgi:hypothetical protein
VGANSNSEWIANVTVGLINNTTANDNGYGDFTGTTTPFIIGQSYPISLTPGFSNFQYTEWFRAYIDLDQDGQFQAGELVFDPGSGSTGTVTGMATIPPGTLPGASRLRVVMKYNAAPLDGCEDGYDYGETEDYCVTLTTGVGIPELTEGMSVQAYPVPADQLLFLDIVGAKGTAALGVDVLDHSGRLVLSRNVPQGLTTLSTASLAEGLYTFRIRQEGKRDVRGRFVVLHDGR